ncbi:MAG: aspartate/tyrosine/aromatic aminotransferase [Sphingosinicella sp.]|nr:aspartate/tyrosine/aromatic aminotransferase [Sphingosinicella sp.]
MFDQIQQPPSDALHGVMEKLRADSRPYKVDLGVGVYRDASGHSPVMRAVKEAEAILIEREDSKAYQSLHGDEVFLEAMTELVFGRDHPAVRTGRIAGIQGTGGTGALRVALDLARLARPDAKVHIGLPTWPNHLSLAEAVGLQIVTHPYFDPVSQAVDKEAVQQAAAATGEGDLFVLHGPCHNPTGADLSAGDRIGLLHSLMAKGAVPLVDLAYYGLGDGLEADLRIVRDLAERAERAFIAVACSKSFGLYRERTGILFVLCANRRERDHVHGQMARISRTLVSMPPAHGAGTVAHILADARLRSLWEAELEEMRQRILGLRGELAALANQAPMLRGVGKQKGIFRMLPISADQAMTIGRDHAIHLAPSGRINIAGLKLGDAKRLAEALTSVE